MKQNHPKPTLAAKAPKAVLSQQTQKTKKDLSSKPSPKKEKTHKKRQQAEDTGTELKTETISSDDALEPQHPVVGQRGKKRCEECQELVPIHCSRCPECKTFEFRMNHKPRKAKEPHFGVHIYSNVSVQEADEISVHLDVMKYYGMQ